MVIYMTLYNFTPAAPPVHPPAPSPHHSQARCMRTGGAKSIRRSDMITQTCNQFNKSVFICVHLRFVLDYFLLPYFSMKPALASDSARFLTQFNDIFFKINQWRIGEN